MGECHPAKMTKMRPPIARIDANNQKETSDKSHFYLCVFCFRNAFVFQFICVNSRHSRVQRRSTFGFRHSLHSFVIRASSFLSSVLPGSPNLGKKSSAAS